MLHFLYVYIDSIVYTTDPYQIYISLERRKTNVLHTNMKGTCHHSVVFFSDSLIAHAAKILFFYRFSPPLRTVFLFVSLTCVKVNCKKT